MSDLTRGLDLLLARMVDERGSDLYLSTGAFAQIRVEGRLETVSEHRLNPGQTTQWASEFLAADQLDALHAQNELNVATAVKGVGRFRLNFFKQRGEIAIVARHIKTQIPQPHDLGLPAIMTQQIMAKNGLILVAGATGMGKSTTLASLVDYRGHRQKNHIITIEDPIEYTYRHSNSIINQREIGLDTLSWDAAIENTLRQSPDVVVIGEIRSRSALENAIAIANTGHLCLSTLHATNVRQVFDRVIHFFPKSQQQSILYDLSHSLRAILCQRLVPSIDGRRRLATECLINNATTGDIIKKGEFTDLNNIIERSNAKGMQTFDQSLIKLHKSGVISEENALLYADSEHDMRLKLHIESGCPELDSANQDKLHLQQDGSKSLLPNWFSGNNAKSNRKVD